MRDFPPELYQLAEKIAAEHQDTLEKIERRRQKTFPFIIASSVILAVLPLILFHSVFGRFFFESLRADPFPVYAGVFMLLFIAGLIALFFVFDTGYRRRSKYEFLPLIAQAVRLDYSHGGSMKLGDLYDHLVLPPYTTHKNEEGFKGRYKSFDFFFQDFVIQPRFYWRFFDWRSLLHPFGLRGSVMKIKLHKNFKNHTILLPRFLAQGFLKRTFHKKFHSFENINLVSHLFHKQYTVLSTHQIDARYALDPAVIERLINLHDNLNAQWLEMSIFEDAFVLYIRYKENLFEPGHLFQPVTLYRIEEMLRQIHMFVTIIDTLELSPLVGLGGPQTRFT